MAADANNCSSVVLISEAHGVEMGEGGCSPHMCANSCLSNVTGDAVEKYSDGAPTAVLGDDQSPFYGRNRLASQIICSVLKIKAESSPHFRHLRTTLIFNIFDKYDFSN